MADGKITRQDIFSDDVQKAIQDVTSDLKSLTEELIKVTKVASDYRAEMGNATKSATDLNKIENETKDIIDKIAIAEQTLLDKKKELNIEQEKQKKANKEANDIAKLKATIDSKEAGGIEKLRAQIKLLYIERNKLKDSDKDYIKNVENHNKKISEQEAKLKSLSSATEKQRANIGNYKSALSDLSPQFGMVSNKASQFGGILTKLGPWGVAALGTIVAVGAPLVAFFTQSEKGAEMLERKVAGLKAAFGILGGELINLGSNVEKADQGSIKWGSSFKPIAYILSGIAGLIPGVRNKIDEIATKMDDASKAAEDYTTKLQELEDIERSMIVKRAETNKQIANAKLLYEDETLSISERMNALKNSLDLEIQTTDSEIEYQKNITKNLETINKEKEKAGQLRDEDLRKLEEAKAKEIDLETESAIKKRKIQSTLNNAQKQFDDQRKKNVEDKLTFELSLIIDEQQKEEAELKRKYTKDLESAKKYGTNIILVTNKYNSDLAAIKKKYDDKKTIEDEKAQKLIEDEAKAIIDSAKNAYKRKFEIAKESVDKIDEYEDAALSLELQNMKELIDNLQINDELKRQMLDEYYKYEAQLKNESAENTRKTEEEKLKYIEDATNASIDLLNSFADLNTALGDRRIQEIETRSNKELNDLEILRKTRIQNGQDETKVDEEISRRREEIEKRTAIEIAKIRRSQAIMEKTATLFSIAAQTARAVMMVWGETGLGAIILQALPIAAGILQAAAVVAAPLPEIPKFEKGGKLKKTGVIEYGEKGHELVTLPSGEQYLSPAIPTLAILPQGTDIKPADLTQKILQDSIYKINLNSEKKDENQILNEINKTLKGLKQVNVNVDKWGFRISATEGANRTKYLNEKFRC